VRRIEEKAGRSTFIKTDVTDTAQVNDMVQAAVETYGGLDILLSNAGVAGTEKLVTDITDEDWEGVIDVNLNGGFRSCRAAIPEIAKRGGGAIVITAASEGIVPYRQYSPYCASNAGLISLTKTLAIECAPLKIRVNVVAVGEMNTAMEATDDMEEEAQETDEPREESILMGRIAEPEEIALIMLFLVTDASSYITGEVIVADGGDML
jgi:NAD(P)-dependent dehydrogenase (short-subunit alcohol dehydrogenase family)